MKRHRICFLAAEISPFAKTGGLGDVASALVRQMSRRGHDVRVYVPLHAVMDLSGVERRPVENLRGLRVTVGTTEYRYDVHEARLPGSDEVWVNLVDCPAAFDRPYVYSDAPDEHQRFLLLTRAALECCQRTSFAPDIVHCNDWHTAFAPLLLKTAYAWDRLFAPVRSVITIHNIGYQGVFPPAPPSDSASASAPAPAPGRPARRQGQRAQARHPLRRRDHHRQPDLRAGDHDAAVRHGPRRRAALSAPRSLHGILNGVDYDDWDPRHDRYLPLPLRAGSLRQGRAGRGDARRCCACRRRERDALFGIVSRFTPQKGLDLLFDTLPALLERARPALVALGNGDARYEVSSLDCRSASRGACLHRGYSDELAHWIEAASDAFLMPSLYEPCGLNQMYSLRYGTVPIVRRTGGLADSRAALRPATGTGTGVVFNDFDAGGLHWGVTTALEWFGWPSVWRRLVHNGMAQDFSWDTQAAEYERLYERLTSP
jgi:starch synthase